jgi:hypothetical protein
VSSRELELRKLIVVETRQPPIVDAVAGFARGWKSGGAVIDALSLLILRLMASDALRAQARVDARCGSAMAGVARNRRVSAQQREAIQVVLDRSGGDPPSLNRVAVLTLSAELTPVKIRVTGRTLRPSFGKNSRDVARITGYVLMHPSQGKLSLVVIELGLGAQRREARGGVAVLTRDRNRPVRIPRRLALDGWHEPESQR